MPMFNTNEILDTIHMIDQQHLDVRTVTMGVSLLDCADPDPKAACEKTAASPAGQRESGMPKRPPA